MPASENITVGDLIRIAPPPELLIGRVGWERWNRIESDLGTILPRDYKLIMTSYGVGYFNDLFWLSDPGSMLGEDSPAEIYEEFRDSSPEECPFSTFPGPGSLLSLGGTTNGGYAFWLTEGLPDEWPLIFYDHGFYMSEKYSMRLVEFLVRWLSGEMPGCFFGAGECFKTDPIFQN
ncbi:SMI1/KNR4 family protein [Tundrisphaera sp. TA3]|uniref:SMI1/KNR4 family protein n=1 Tax=Tundrisphaera sp. TA3 TaxID=3435775 RepID=UPI003EB79AB6